MSAKVQFYATPGGLKAIANGAEVQAVCLKGAASAASQAAAIDGYPYTADVQPGKFRAHARATSQATPGAYWTGIRNKTLKRVKPHI